MVGAGLLADPYGELSVTNVLAAAYTRNPERFVRKHPEPAALATAA